MEEYRVESVGGTVFYRGTDKKMAYNVGERASLRGWRVFIWAMGAAMIIHRFY